jgi:hypothetical protein
MDGQARIKFNPITKEIEIEGSEQFVKTYFDKIQSMLSGKEDAVLEAPVKGEKAPEGKPAGKVRQSKRAPIASNEVNVAKQIKKGGMSRAVLALIRNSKEGLTTTELKEKTGLTDRQIWPIVSSAKKTGKIKLAKPGVYIKA